MPNLLLGLAVTKTSTFKGMTSCNTIVNPQTKKSGCTLTVFRFFKFSLLYVPSTGFSEKSDIRQGHKLVGEKLFFENIYLLLVFEFL